MKILLAILLTSLVIVVLMFILNAATYNGSHKQNQKINDDKKIEKN